MHRQIEYFAYFGAIERNIFIVVSFVERTLLRHSDVCAIIFSTDEVIPAQYLPVAHKRTQKIPQQLLCPTVDGGAVFKNKIYSVKHICPLFLIITDKKPFFNRTR